MLLKTLQVQPSTMLLLAQQQQQQQIYHHHFHLVSIPNEHQTTRYRASQYWYTIGQSFACCLEKTQMQHQLVQGT